MVMSDKNGADVANVDAGFCDTARDAIPRVNDVIRSIYGSEDWMIVPGPLAAGVRRLFQV